MVAQALGCSNSAGEPAFSLSDSFRKQLNKNIDVAIPKEPTEPKEAVFVAMDYHLDWLQAALTLAHCQDRAHSQDGKYQFSNEGEKGQVIEGTQEDVDLLVAFKTKAGKTIHLILVEAKAYSGWTNKQLSSKAERLRTIFGEDGKKWSDVQPYFCAIAPRDPNKSKLLKRKCLPKWMLKNNKLQWLCLQLPKRERRKVSRKVPYDKERDGKERGGKKTLPAIRDSDRISSFKCDRPYPPSPLAQPRQPWSPRPAAA